MIEPLIASAIVAGAMALTTMLFFNLAKRYNLPTKIRASEMIEAFIHEADPKRLRDKVIDCDEFVIEFEVSKYRNSRELLHVLVNVKGLDGKTLFLDERIVWNEAR